MRIVKQNISRINSIFFFFLCAFSNNVFARCEDNLLKEAQAVFSFHNFDVERTLPEYYRQLGRTFLSKLAELGPKHHWLDSGAGNLGAISGWQFRDQMISIGATKERPKEFIEYANFYNHIINTQSTESGPKITAVTFKIDSRRKVFPLQESSSLLILAGKYLEEIPNTDLMKNGSVDLISDVFGVFAYTSNLHLVLSKYQEILSKNGEGYFLLGVGNSVVYQTKILTDKGKENIPEWLVRMFPDVFSIVKADFPPPRFYNGKPVGEETSFVLVMKKSTSEFRLPTFNVIEYETNFSGAGSRTFKLTKP